MNLNEVNKPIIEGEVVVYAGRFQPFHRGHYDAYQRLVNEFGSANVYIATSNDTSSGKSPFSFKEKKEIATKMFGVPSTKFVKVNNPYRPVEILKQYDGQTIAYIAAVGDKDATRLQGKYFKPYKGKAGYGYDEIGYTYSIPAEKNPISGTDVRRGLGSNDLEKAKKFFLKAYPKFDKDIFKMITTKLNEGFPGGIGTGLNLPGGYINGAPTGSIKELVNQSITEDEFNQFVSQYFKEETEAEKMGLTHLGGGYYGKDKGQGATHKSDNGKLRALTPAEVAAEKQKQMAKGPSDAPANEPKPSQPGQPVNKGATAQGKTDTEKEKSPESKPGEEKQEAPPEQKLSGDELKSSAEKNAEGGEESPKEKAERENKEKLDKEIEHEKSDLSHEEKNAYEFLDGLPDEEKAKAIDDALNKRNIIQVIAQDTVVGGWLAKKGNQLKETFNGLSSFLRTGRTGAHKDCSGAPPGPHAKDGWSLGTNLAEDAESRRKYLSKLDATGNEPDPSKKPPVDKSKCKDVHYGDYQKRDENGKRVYKEEPVYESGEKPDPAGISPIDGAYFPGLGTGYVGPNGANVGREEAFKANELDSKTGYFKRDGKYYDKNGAQVNEKGHTLNADGQPTQQTTLKLWPLPPKRVPKTQKSPVYEDGLSHEQEHAAHESHHKAHTQQHAIEHTIKELSAILGGAMAGPVILSKLGLGQAAATAGTEAAHHGAAELAKHILKDGIKHAGFEMLGINTAEKAAGAGLTLSAATGGILEELCNDANMLLESNDKDANKKFFLKLLRKMAEAYKGYKMTPEQKLESLRTYKGLQYIKKENNKKASLTSLLKENLSETKQNSINHFVEYATKKLKLKETPKITLLSVAALYGVHILSKTR